MRWRSAWQWLRELKGDIFCWPGVDVCARRSEDKVVQTVDWFFGLLQAVWNFPAYAWLSRRAQRRWSGGNPWQYFNHLYGGWVGGWVFLIVALSFVASLTSGWGRAVILGVALWRVAEIVTWYLKLLFDKGHRVLIEVERNLWFLILDGLVFVTVLALMLEVGHDRGVLHEWPDALSAFTLNGRPEGYGGRSATLVGVVGAGGGIVLLGAGLALLTGIISQRIERAKGQSYTGPTRPPGPWH